jgi:glycosyltransferase involved in cell wall biosynthesis
MQKLLIIGFVWPEPSSSAAGIRMVQLIQLFRKLNYDIVFASAAADSEHRVEASLIGVQYESILLNHESFDSFLLQCNPEVVLFDRFIPEEQFGWRVADVLPNALKILDTEDLHFLRDARKVAWKENRDTQISDFHSDKSLRELASIYRCDASLIISMVEYHLLKERMGIPEQLLFYFPLLPSSSLDQTELPVFNKRQHFVFIGNFLHEPNYAAVVELKEQIWPIIQKQLPGAEMHIYGAYPSAKVQNLHQAKERFLIKGRADNAQETVKNYRVCLAPLRFGAGLKGKLIEAMICGTPSITTPIGCEGISSEDIWPGYIKNSAEELANAAIALYTNEVDWKEKQRMGFEILQSAFNEKVHEERFIHWFKKLKQEMSQSRWQNFVGAMLKFEQLQATKFMSKWIEEKNKPKL